MASDAKPGACTNQRVERSSDLAAPREEVWRWITSFEGVAAEMGPWLRMTAPRGVRALGDVELRPGERLFRSWILLFGLLPVDFSDLTLLSLEPGRCFVERSPMGSMRVWRHERALSDLSPRGTRLVDRLDFEPRALPGLAAAIVRRLFDHRHAILRRRFGRA